MSQWYFNPVMFEIGPLKAHWYGFMYALGFVLAYIYLHYSNSGKKIKLNPSKKDTLLSLLIAGVLLGGRLGYIIFYNLSYYLNNPAKIFTVWEGGMSFHGGVLGVFLVLLWFSKKHKYKFFDLSDTVVTIAPLGLFFGRIGNFINGELYGRIATQYCLYFPTDPTNCRYPSQLLQALLEGLLLFLILFYINRKNPERGIITALFLFLYGVFRIFSEFFREPDAHIGFLFNIITEGQLLSIFMIIVGIFLYASIKKTHSHKKM